MMEYALLALPVGSYIVYLYFSSYNANKLPNYWSIPIYVSMGISFLNLILPMDTLNKKLFKLQKDSEVSPSYTEVEGKFDVTYEMTNPGYTCKRKRKRDINSINAGHQSIPLADMGHYESTKMNNSQLNSTGDSTCR